MQTRNPQSVMQKVKHDYDDESEGEEEEQDYDMPTNPQSMMIPVEKTKGPQGRQDCVMLEKGRHNTAYRNLVGGYDPNELVDEKEESKTKFHSTPVTTQKPKFNLAQTAKNNKDYIGKDYDPNELCDDSD